MKHLLALVLGLVLGAAGMAVAQSTLFGDDGAGNFFGGYTDGIGNTYLYNSNGGNAILSTPPQQGPSRRQSPC